MSQSFSSRISSDIVLQESGPCSFWKDQYCGNGINSIYGP